MKNFELKTKIGTLHFRVNGANEIYVDTTIYNERGSQQDRCPVTIRGKQHYGNVRFGLNPRTGEWDGRTYAHNGNDVVFVSDQQNEYFKARACYLNQVGCFGNESTSAAKTKFYEEIKAAVNEFWRTNKEAIGTEMAARNLERAKDRFENAEAKIESARLALVEASKECHEAREVLIKLGWVPDAELTT